MKKKTPLILVLTFSILTSCGVESNKSTREPEIISDSIQSEYKGPLDDILNNKNLIRGRDTLMQKLKNSLPDSSNFDNYHALIVVFIDLEDSYHADSVHKLIRREDLSGFHELQWINNSINIGLRMHRFSEVLDYLEEEAKNNSSRVPDWIRKNDYLYLKWFVYSMTLNCDSSKRYLNLYIVSARKPVISDFRG
jgi:hypothetical protein